MINRRTRLAREADLTVDNVEQVLEEIAKDVPSPDEYRAIRCTGARVTGVIPSGTAPGEPLVDESDPENLKIVIRVGDKMYKVADLEEIIDG